MRASGSPCTSAAISRARSLKRRSPAHVEWCAQIRALPFKKATPQPVAYLEKTEIDALLAAPDGATPQGRRESILLLFLYNTGARADEATKVRVGDLQLSEGSKAAALVTLRGKGGRLRQCPLWPRTASDLTERVAGRAADRFVFLNRRGHPITRFGIGRLVGRNAEAAAARAPSLSVKNVTPHVIRHTTATHLLRAGVDLNTIRAWLGHVKLDTTNIYAEIDLETKAKATDPRSRTDRPCLSRVSAVHTVTSLTSRVWPNRRAACRGDLRPRWGAPAHRCRPAPGTSSGRGWGAARPHRVRRRRPHVPGLRRCARPAGSRHQPRPGPPITRSSWRS